jgi:hypothetical protein
MATPNSNPWTYENWNLTEQGRFFVAFGLVKCEQLAAAAGTTVGGPKPKPAHEVKVIERHWIIQKKQVGGGSGGGLVGAGSSGSGPPA